MLPRIDSNELLSGSCNRSSDSAPPTIGRVGVLVALEFQLARNMLQEATEDAKLKGDLVPLNVCSIV